MPARSRPIYLNATRRRLLLWAAAGVLFCSLLGGGWLWLRDSPLVSVQSVRITGVHGPQAAQLKQVLTAAAKRMTTMDFDVSALRAAAASFPVVKEVHAATGFPHSVRIGVVERLPVAVLVGSGARVSVAADGTVLGEAAPGAVLPTIGASTVPLAGKRVSDWTAFSAVAVLGAAPARLGRFVARAFEGPEGLTLAMRNGLTVYFGDANRPLAKWLSLASVLADPGSEGAWYVDVRIPERPAAGTRNAGSIALKAMPAGQAVGSETAAAALAERLAATVGGEVVSSSAAGAESPSAASSSSATAPLESTQEGSGSG